VSSMEFATKSTPAPAPKPAPMAQQPVQQRVVVVEPIRVFDPFFAYPYPYAYEPDLHGGEFWIRQDQDGSQGRLGLHRWRLCRQDREGQEIRASTRAPADHRGF